MIEILSTNKKMHASFSSYSCYNSIGAVEGFDAPMEDQVNENTIIRQLIFSY